jgi:hypothetical protein
MRRRMAASRWETLDMNVGSSSLRLCLAGVLTLGSLALGSAAVAHPDHGGDGGFLTEDGARDAHQHGDTSGHLPATQSGVELISSLTLKNAVPEKIADVTVLDGYAYLAAWGVATCKYNGVHVVDVNDPAKPKEVAFIPSKEGSYPGEGMQALAINTASFSGNILVTNNEKCRDGVGFGGINIYDISRPARPVPLAVGFGDVTSGPSLDASKASAKKAAHETHSVFAWSAGDKAYAVMVDNEERWDVDIVDITNPRQPVMIAEYDLAETFPQIVQSSPANLVEVFLHDMVVKEIEGRFIMSAAYWDAGYVLLDVTNPADISYVADSDFAAVDALLQERTGVSEPPEGNAHQSEFTLDNRYLIGTDEDFTPNQTLGRTDDMTSSDPDFFVSQGSDTPQLGAGQSLSGDAVYVGQACTGDAIVPTAPETASGSQFAVAVRGVCTFTEKVQNIQDKGYEGIVIVNREGSCTAFGMSVQGTTPTFSVSREVGYGFFDLSYDATACAAGSASLLPGVAHGAVGDAVTLRAFFDGWGYVRLFERGTGKLSQLDSYAIAEAHDVTKASGFGDLSVHEVATSLQDPRLAYLAYYSGGLRVLRINESGGSATLEEVGRYIETGGSNIWGVEVFVVNGVEYIAASDRDSGLRIFRYTGGG